MNESGTRAKYVDPNILRSKNKKTILCGVVF